jgi:hypothetical protein
MVTFYADDIHQDEYDILSVEDKSKYKAYTYYLNNENSNLLWYDAYSQLSNEEQNNYTETRLYSKYIPIDYPRPRAPSEEDIQWVRTDSSWRNMREARNKTLKETDWTQVNDNDLSDDTKESWRVYRNTLRNLPSTYTDETIMNWKIPNKNDIGI